MKTKYFTYPGVEKKLRFVHIAISEAATNWQPEAAAIPSTHAMMGKGQSIIVFMSFVANEKTVFWFSGTLYNNANVYAV